MGIFDYNATAPLTRRSKTNHKCKELRVLPRQDAKKLSHEQCRRRPIGAVRFLVMRAERLKHDVSRVMVEGISYFRCMPAPPNYQFIFLLG